MAFKCLSCRRTFSKAKDVQSHARVEGHQVLECEDCERIFANEGDLTDHLNNVIIHRHCFDCDKTFKARYAYEQHLADSPYHRVASDEDEYSSEDSSDASSDNHWRNVTCHRCNTNFVDKAALNHHLAASPVHNWCFVCSRDFPSTQALAQHNSSVAHRDRTYKCPFCDNLFKTPSSIAMHVESGCHDINRHQVTDAVHRLNVVPQISVDRRIGGPAEPRQLLTDSATEYTFNGYAYECYLCHSAFQTLARLNQHLNSPTHDDTEFRCPSCKTEFQLISGLIQHIESESCGITRFKAFTNHFESATSQGRPHSSTDVVIMQPEFEYVRPRSSSTLLTAVLPATLTQIVGAANVVKKSPKTLYLSLSIAVASSDLFA